VLPAGTFGLMSLLDEKVVFATTIIDMGSTGYKLIVLKHPTIDGMELQRIHYAQAFMRAPYIIAEFIDGTVQHYWLQTPQAWQASTMFDEGVQVVPSVENGYAYTAVRTFATQPAWKPLTAKVVGDTIEPTVPNGYYAEVISVGGDKPTTGAIEPEWPAASGALVIEYSSGLSLIPTGTPPGSTGGGGGDGDHGGVINPDTRDRYGNRAFNL
jgi:hypothetical protein